MNTRLSAAAAAAVVGLFAGACASGGAAVETNADADGRTVLSVTNYNWSDVTVYAVQLGHRLRLGTVTSMTTRRFTVPVGGSLSEGGLSFLATPIGSTRTHQTDRIMVDPGDRIEWKLENSLALSSYMVRSGNAR